MILSNKRPPLPIGLIAGGTAALLANLYLLAHSSLTGTNFPELNVLTVTLAALLANLGAAYVFAWIRRARSPQIAPQVYLALGIFFALLSIVPGLIHPLHPGMNAAAIPLHFIVALTALILIPIRSS